MPDKEKCPTNDPSQAENTDRTMKMAFDPKKVELTQKIEVDHNEVVDNNIRKRTLNSINFNDNDAVPGASQTKSLFSKKLVTDDYVRSSSILSAIGDIPPLEEDLELQNVHSNYELKNKFSEGAQGEIRTAFDKSLKREIVVKSLKPVEIEEQAKEDESLFVSEARIMAQLDHPSIIPLYGLHCGAKNKLHLAMKHIHGKTLQRYIHDIVGLYAREGIDNFDEKRSIATRIEYLIKVCEAVDYAHRKGVIHRDIKPENIMIGNYGEVYVMDWGLACLFDPEKFKGDEHVTKTSKHTRNQLIGTPCYLAPELIRGGDVSPQSDIFSLGMILYEIVTLERAVPGETVNEVLKNIINWNYRPFKHRFLKNKLPDDLKSIIAKATCEPASRRYKSANAMAEDLKLFLMREETAARPDNFIRKIGRIIYNHKMLASIIIMSVLLIFAASTIHSLYAKNALMREQRIREDILANFQNEVAGKAGRMERLFDYYNNQLDVVAYQIGYVLSKKSEDKYKYYTLQDYKGSSPPPDYAFSPGYGIGVSLDYPVLKMLKGKTQMDTLDKRVIALTPLFKHLMFISNPKFKKMSESEVKKDIMQHGAPLVWITLGLKNGSIFAYPGTKVYKEDYDPCIRPWYKKALKQNGDARWSEPFKGALTKRIVMSTTQCVYGTHKDFMGVISVHIRLDYMREKIFGTGIPGVKEYLINNKGQVLISSDFKDEGAKINKRNTRLIMKDFIFKDDFCQALKDNKVLFEADKYNNKYLFVMMRLPSVGYYYVQQISEKRLRKDWERWR